MRLCGRMLLLFDIFSLRRADDLSSVYEWMYIHPQMNMLALSFSASMTELEYLREEEGKKCLTDLFFWSIFLGTTFLLYSTYAHTHTHIDRQK